MDIKKLFKESSIVQKKKQSKTKKFIPIVQYQKKITFCIEILNNNNLMKEKELKSLSNQLKTIYSVNKRTIYPVNLVFSNYEQIREYMPVDSEKWNILKINESLFLDFSYKEKCLSLFGVENVVFLSSDAPTSLECIEEHTLYVIGGLVDKNRHKGYSYNIFTNLNIPCYKLPIKENIKIFSSTTLATNHVFEIFADFLVTNDWKETLTNKIPKRKQMKN
ncbi:tRNA (Guanine-1)-methyltransferase [Hamiltosporidium tvaerminnensis]|uniref:tRNA (guanine(9)-N1)-methyltransferase n=2 Tax=Hamiltosporidium TaxID=1176354 RepID=A0A4Q9KUZ8_9MICR|nr:tRNA methyltransferase 10 [Hamiltosporidium tvaerminnensis]TBT97839.1 tRNA (Guanine-1)-methyltransferase [Hamiltosporidium magnivora]TBT98075.1 tRNA (Guanine-1)-methyltransferase [Hamiltosporidium tvaerminnensis]TBU00448.1 tRNA (Guanine-1)-methyltransferase [Hamiltosporidium magnivora]TBU07919.1 tRNA (Guanine-1)-methyltransferase [Hamiltosporidium tvaerminnensis]